MSEIVSRPEGRARLAVLLFTDIVDSVNLQRRAGTETYARLLERHDGLFRRVIAEFGDAEIIKHTGDGFLAKFRRSCDAVRAALHFQSLLFDALDPEFPIAVRTGLHLGEILEDDVPDDVTRPGAVGMAVNLAARIMGLAQGGQILLTRPVFDEARLFVRDESSAGSSALEWVAHGPYLFKGHDEPVDIFEVGTRGLAPLTPPPDSAKARRSVSVEDIATLGWRPAAGLEIPRRNGWELVRKLGRGGFGEVWLARNVRTREERVFKFCFDPAQLRSFKRELTLFRLIRDALGRREDIAPLHEVSMEAPPFYLESDYCEGGNLRQWAANAGGMGHVPVPTRLDLCIRICRAVAAAHSLGIIHRDIKPSNIFITETDHGPRPRLADFGIGVLADPGKVERYDVTLTGFTIDSSSPNTGTSLYAAPEYLLGCPPTMEGDVYALGVVTYQIMTGSLDHPLGTGWERRVADPLLRNDIAAAVDVEPARRIASAAEFAERLESLETRRQAAGERNRLEEQAAAAALHRKRLRLMVAASAAGILLTTMTIFLAIREAGRSRDLEAAGRLTESARAEAVRSLVMLQTGTGIARGDGGEVSLGALWMTAAARSAQGSESERDSLIRVRNYMQSSPFPLAAVRSPGGEWVQRILLHPFRDHLLLHSRINVWSLHNPGNPDPETLPGTAPHRAAAWSGDGSLLFVADSEGTLFAIDDASGKVVASLHIGAGVTALAVSHDGRLLVAAGREAVLVALEPESRLPALRLVGSPASLAGNARAAWAGFSPDETMVAVASSGTPGRVTRLGVHPQESVQSLRHLGTAPHRMASVGGVTQSQAPVFLPDGRLIIQPDDGAPAVTVPDGMGIDAGATAALQNSVDGKSPIVSLAVTPDGGALAVGGFHYFTVVDPSGKRGVISRTAAGHDVTFIGFTPAADYMVTASCDGMVNVWSRETDDGMQVPLRRWDAASGAVTCAALSPDGSRLAVADHSSGMVRVWGGVFGCPPELVAPIHGGWSRVAVSPSGRYFAPSGSSFRIQSMREIGVYSTETFAPEGPQWRLSESPQAAVFTADERYLLTAGARRLQKWNFRSGREEANALDMGDVPSAAMVLSPDGAHVAIYQRDGWLRIVRVEDLRPVAAKQVSQPSDSYFYFYNGLLDWLTDSGRIAIASTDGRASLYRFDGTSLSLESGVMETGSNINVFARSAGGQIWMTAGNDGLVRTWNPETGQPGPYPALAHPDTVFNAVLSPDGKELLTTCRDGSARVWDPVSGEMLCPPAAVANEMYFAHWLQDGSHYVTGAKDTGIRIWERSTGQPMMPPLPAGANPLMSLEAPGGGEILLASGSGPLVSGIRCSEWLKVPAATLGELERLAELMANSRLIGSNEARLTPAEWEDRWKALRNPALYSGMREVMNDRMAAWHRRELQISNHTGQPGASLIHARALQRVGDPSVPLLHAESLDKRSLQDPGLLPQTIEAWRRVVLQLPGAVQYRLRLANALVRSGDSAGAWVEARHLLMAAPENAEIWQLAEASVPADHDSRTEWSGLREAAGLLYRIHPALAKVPAEAALSGTDQTLHSSAAALAAAPQSRLAMEHYAAALASATLVRSKLAAGDGAQIPSAVPPGPWLRLLLILESVFDTSRPDTAGWTAEFENRLARSGEGSGLAGYPQVIISDSSAATMVLRPAGRMMTAPDGWDKPGESSPETGTGIRLPLCVNAKGLDAEAKEALRGATAAWIRCPFRAGDFNGTLHGIEVAVSGRDGWIVWCNGHEIGRHGVPEGPPGPATRAGSPGRAHSSFRAGSDILSVDQVNTLCIAVFAGEGSDGLDCHLDVTGNAGWLPLVYPLLTREDRTSLFEDSAWPVPEPVLRQLEQRFGSRPAAAGVKSH